MVQLPHNIQAVYLQNCLKILAHLLPSQSKSSSVPISVTDITVVEDTPTPLPNGTREEDGDIKESEEVPLEEEQQEGKSEEEVVVDEQEIVNEQKILNEQKIVDELKIVVEQDAINLTEIQEHLKPFISSEELEVQERAGCLNNFIKCYQKLESKGLIDDIGELSLELASAFSSELNPVAVKAQKKVPVPEGLDLDEWINDPPSDSEEETTETTDVFVKTHTAVDFGQSSAAEKKKVYEPSVDELSKVSFNRDGLTNFCKTIF